MVTKIEIRRTIFLSFIIMLILMITGGAVWSLATSMGITKSGGLWYNIVIIIQLIIAWLIFLESLIFFGNIVELQGKEPGIITIGISYIPSALYLYAIGMLGRLGPLFALVSIFIILYVLYSE